MDISQEFLLSFQKQLELNGHKIPLRVLKDAANAAFGPTWEGTSADRIISDILTGTRFGEDDVKDLPKEPGLYAFFLRDFTPAKGLVETAGQTAIDGEIPVYTGKATGAMGLLGRIKQHYSETYLERRASKFGNKDKPTMIGGSLVVEKSALRRKTSRRLGVPTGKAHKFVKQKMEFTYVTLADLDREEIIGIETEIIRRLRPFLNG